MLLSPSAKLIKGTFATIKKKMINLKFFSGKPTGFSPGNSFIYELRPLLVSVLLVFAIVQQTYATGKTDSSLSGFQLYSTVKKYVSLGEHRTGTPTDIATSYWLGKELAASGFNVKYLTFPVKQFFLESASVNGSELNVKAFPLWWVNDQISLTVSGKIVVAKKANPTSLNGNIALIQIPGAGATTQPLINAIDSLTKLGVKGIIAITKSKVGEIVASNTKKDQKPWKVPVVLVAQHDVNALEKAIAENRTVQLSIKGQFKQVEARNVYGTIGSGTKYIVVSTPISGWFTCGGERGPGVSIWLALAKWAATHHDGYTFVFTGNSGHELNSEGAQQFLERAAPAIDETKLWIHLGAGVATLQYKETPNGVTALKTVDPARSFFYNQSVSESFTSAFKNIAGNKLLTEKPGGELIHVAQKGYKRYVGISHGHPYFHVSTDDASTTSPEILEETVLAFKTLLEIETNNQ